VREPSDEEVTELCVLLGWNSERGDNREKARAILERNIEDTG
jgi:hypothetical protein